MPQAFRGLLLGIIVVSSVIAAPVRYVTARDATPAASSASSPGAARSGPFSGLVDIGDRSLYLRCEGEGSPTVILEAGRFASDTWDAVLAGVAPLTRVCLYDRANQGLSDPAPLPRSGQDVVKDLHALLMAADVPGPFVLVGATMGGLFTRLYAATYPDDVVGMVLSNAIYEELYTLQALAMTPADNAETVRIDMEGGDVEGIWTTESLPITFEEVRLARLDSPLKAMPLVVLAAGSFPPDPHSPYPKGSDAVWPTLSILTQKAQAQLTDDARFVLVPDSGSLIQVEQPAVVIAAIVDVVKAVRDPGTWARGDAASSATPLP